MRLPGLSMGGDAPSSPGCPAWGLVESRNPGTKPHSFTQMGFPWRTRGTPEASREGHCWALTGVCHGAALAGLCWWDRAAGVQPVGVCAPRPSTALGEFCPVSCDSAFVFHSLFVLLGVHPCSQWLSQNWVPASCCSQIREPLRETPTAKVWAVGGNRVGSPCPCSFHSVPCWPPQG